MITTGLVDTFTTPKLLKLIAEGRLDPTPFATHRFELADTEQAYDVFSDAANTNALKVVLTAEAVAPEPSSRTPRPRPEEDGAGRHVRPAPPVVSAAFISESHA